MSRILLVEDDPVTQDAVRALCESRGHAVDVASDGFTGLKLLREHDYAIALVDYHLPEMDGFALARLMRDVGGGRKYGPKLVGVTADRHELAARRGSESVFDSMLSKPLTPNSLFCTLEQLDPAMAERQPACPANDPVLSAADRLWRQFGLDGRPITVCVPPATPDQAEALRHCFTLVADATAADTILVLDGNATSNIRDAAFMVPLVNVSGGAVPDAELSFVVTDPDSWRNLAATVRRFRERREIWSALTIRPSAGAKPATLKL